MICEIRHYLLASFQARFVLKICEHSSVEPFCNHFIGPFNCLFTLSYEGRWILGNNGLPHGNPAGILTDFFMCPFELLYDTMRWYIVQLRVDGAQT